MNRGYIIQYTKRVTAPIIIYLYTKHCELKQRNGNPTLATERCKGSGGGGGVVFLH